MNLMLHTLRLLINMTNDFEPCCKMLAKSDSISVLVQNIVQFYDHCRQVPTLNGHGKVHATTNGAVYGYSPGPIDDLPLEDKQDDKNWRQQVQNDTSGWYDILLMSIGLLINMLETNADRRAQFTDTCKFSLFGIRGSFFDDLLQLVMLTLATFCFSYVLAIALECSATGDCLHRECLCEKSDNVLERLVDVYNTEVTISEMVRLLEISNVLYSFFFCHQICCQRINKPIFPLFCTHRRTTEFCPHIWLYCWVASLTGSQRTKRGCTSLSTETRCSL